MPRVILETFIGQKDATRINVETLIFKYADAKGHESIVE